MPALRPVAVHMLIATTGTGALHEPNEALLVASLAVSALTFLALAVVAMATRVREPDEGPATMDPPARDERPALVGFLARDFEVPTEAVAATLVDLAARGWISIEPAGGDQLVVRAPRRDGKGRLAPYEKRVLDHVRGLAVARPDADGGGVVPAGALTTGTEDASARWWASFAREVVDEARARGLCRNRWPAAVKALLLVGLGGAALLVWAAGGFRDPEEVHSTGLWWGAIAAAVGIVVVGVSVSKSRRQRDTDAGRAAAGRWLGLRRFLVDHGDFPSAPATSVAIWDAYLGWAAAFGLAPLAVESLPLGTEDDHRAWSSYGGTWRRVRVGYPRWRPGWGRHPLMATLTGLVWLGLALLALRGLAAAASSDGFGTDAADRWVDLGAVALAVVALVIAAFSLAGALCGLVDVFRTVEVTPHPLTVLAASPAGGALARGPHRAGGPAAGPLVPGGGHRPLGRRRGLVGADRDLRPHPPGRRRAGPGHPDRRVRAVHRGDHGAGSRAGRGRGRGAGSRPVEPGPGRRGRSPGRAPVQPVVMSAPPPDAASRRSRSLARSSAPVVGATSSPTATPTRNMNMRL
jgi:hypothetical protein